MTDITNNTFTHNDTQQRLRRILDEETITPRATDHEIAPHVPAKEKTGSELIAEKAIAPIRQTGQHVLGQFKPMHDRLDQAEQMVIKAMADGEATVHALMRVFNVAAKIQQDVDRQLAEAMEPLAALMDGRGT